MLDLEKRVQSLVDGTDSLEFDRITFKSPNERLRPSVSGSGRARRLADGAFEVLCNVDRSVIATPVPQTWTIRTPLAGSLFSEDDYYDMEATDFEGNNWTTKHVIIPAIDFFPPDFPLGLLQNVSCRTGYLHMENPASVHAKELQIEYVSESRDNWIPLLNLEIEFCVKTIEQRFTISFGVGGRAGVVVAVVRSDNSIPIGFEHPISEALSFIFDESLDCRLIRRIGGVSRDIIVSRCVTSDYEPSPILRFRADSRRYFILVKQLLEKYLSHIMDRTLEGTTRFHPCTYLLRLLRQPAHTAIDASILTACVVAEAMAWFPVFEAGVDAGADELVNARQEFERCVRDSNYSERTKKRMVGALKRVGEPSVRDRFELFIEQGMICKEDFHAWQNLRHRYAHLKQGTFADELNIRERFRKLKFIHRMIRCMVFACIGYSGEFTDYAVEGYPDVKYPFSTKI